MGVRYSTVQRRSTRGASTTRSSNRGMCTGSWDCRCRTTNWNWLTTRTTSRPPVSPYRKYRTTRSMSIWNSSPQTTMASSISLNSRRFSLSRGTRGEWGCSGSRSTFPSPTSPAATWTNSNTWSRSRSTPTSTFPATTTPTSSAGRTSKYKKSRRTSSTASTPTSSSTVLSTGINSWKAHRPSHTPKSIAPTPLKRTSLSTPRPSISWPFRTNGLYSLIGFKTNSQKTNP